MPTESFRIADQLRRAFAGEAWHGDPLRDILSGITSEQAMARPLSSGHSIWELALHIEAYASAALGTTRGAAMPKIYQTALDWRVVSDASPAAWAAATEHLLKVGEELAQAVEVFGDERLKEIVPGREYDFYYLFHGIVQHSLYHGGQIAMLKRELLASR